MIAPWRKIFCLEFNLWFCSVTTWVLCCWHPSQSWCDLWGVRSSLGSRSGVLGLWWAGQRGRISIIFRFSPSATPIALFLWWCLYLWKCLQNGDKRRIPSENLDLDKKPENEGVQEQKGVMIMINYHSKNYVFLVDRDRYFRSRVCFNGIICAPDLVFIRGGIRHQESCQKEGRKRALAGKPKGKRADLRSWGRKVAEFV